jgi:hypothetical protein
MCLSVSRLFWVSSLAYPNLLGTKGYVVVVVAVATTRPNIQIVYTWQKNHDFGINSKHN